MVRAVDKRCTEIHHLIASEHTALRCLADPLLYRRDVFLRYTAADRRIDKFKAGTRFQRFKFDHTMAVLTTAAGLACIFAVLFDLLGNCLAVSYLGITNVCLHLKLTQQAVYNDIQMQLAHPRDDGLPGFLIGISTECRVLLCQLCQRHGHFLLACLCLRLNGHLNHRFRKFHGLQNNLVVFIAQGIAGRGILQPYDGRDIARVLRRGDTTIINAYERYTLEV